jgi:hypothetical protein
MERTSLRFRDRLSELTDEELQQVSDEVDAEVRRRCGPQG